jgi:hypothetical protein
MNIFLMGLKYSLADVSRRIVLSVLLVLTFTGTGFFAYMNAGFEFYFSWPYVNMNSSHIDTFEFDGVETQVVHDFEQKVNEASPEVYIETFSGYIAHGDSMQDVKLHGASSMSQDALDKTEFNQTIVPNIKEYSSGVILDSETAFNLGVSAGDEVTIIDRISNFEKTTTVASVAKVFGPTQGVLSDLSFFEGIRPLNIKVYGSQKEVNDLFEIAIADGMTHSFKSKEEALDFSKKLAEEFLPMVMGSDGAQWGSIIMSFVVFLLFGSMITSRQITRFFAVAEGAGMRRFTTNITLAVELGLVALGASLIASFFSNVLMYYFYSIPLSWGMYTSTAAILGIGSIVAIAVLLLVHNLPNQFKKIGIRKMVLPASPRTKRVVVN